MSVVVTAEGLQIGQVMAHSEHADQDHRELSGGSRELDSGARHYCLHLRGGGHAAVWQELQGVCV